MLLRHTLRLILPIFDYFSSLSADAASLIIFFFHDAAIDDVLFLPAIVGIVPMWFRLHDYHFF